MKIFNMLKVKQFYKEENYPMFSVKSSDEEEYNQLIALLKKHDYHFFGEPYPFIDNGHIVTLRISTLQDAVTPSLEEMCSTKGVSKIIDVSELKEILKDEIEWSQEK